MKILFAILAVVCVLIVCGCYELQQEEHSDRLSDIIGCIGCIAFIMSIAFITLIFK